ncbi:hypothetical protein Tco_1316621 [Tanacetum coccineum]
MWFLTGLDEIYAPIRRIIFITDPILDIRGAFDTLSRDESHRSSQNSSVPKTRNKDQLTSNSFTDDQFKKLMALISDKSGSSSMPANIAVSKLNMTVGHPNGIKAVVFHVGSLRLTDQIVIHDVLVVPGYEVILLFVHKLSKDNKYRVMFDEDTCVIQDFVQRTKVRTSSENNGKYFFNTGNGYSLKDKNEVKTDKTEHGNGKSKRVKAEDVFILKGPTRTQGCDEEQRSTNEDSTAEIDGLESTLKSSYRRNTPQRPRCFSRRL